MSPIRRAEPRDLPRLQDVERAAGAAFRDLGMVAVAEDDPPTLEVLDAYRVRGQAWVVTGEDDVAVGYLLLDVVDGAAHVEQVSVDPACARRGLGQQLLDAAARWAIERGFTAMTLTTFADVPWNAPYYERCGFRRLAAAELTPGLVAIRRREAGLGLDRWPRVCMRRDAGDRG